MKALLLLMFFTISSSAWADKIEVIDEGEVTEKDTTTTTISKPVYTKKVIKTWLLSCIPQTEMDFSQVYLYFPKREATP